MTDARLAELAAEKIDPANPIASASHNEQAICARLAELHPDDPDEWATWENVMKVRHGDEPQRRRK